LNTINDDHDQAIHAAAELIGDADGLIITAGAGIGIDSGLPDFRGENGFWKAYPALGKLGLSFAQIANPRAFKANPELAWGFYGHRLQLYRDTVPHEGFQRLLQLAKKMPLGARVFTSNVDGQFQKAGFKPEHVTECHGSIHYLQCVNKCGQSVLQANSVKPVIDIENCTMQLPLPHCPACGSLARPNIMLFGDWDFDGARYQQSSSRLMSWLARLTRPVVIEIGAGTAIPSARHFGEELNCPLIRINPGESQIGLHRDISIALGAREALMRISDLILNPQSTTNSK
jgi:NAD-dependent SIR2 family protein deacetylase